MTVDSSEQIKITPTDGNIEGHRKMASQPKGRGSMTLALRSLPLPRMDQQSAKIIALGRVLDEFRLLNRDMLVSQVQAFLMVALDAGLGMMEISDAADIKASTASRWLLEMGPSRFDGDDEAFGLIERRVDPDDARRAIYKLTPAGRKLARAITKALSVEAE